MVGKVRRICPDRVLARLTAVYVKKTVWLEICGPVFHGFSAEVDPRDPPRSPGPARTSISTENQPRRQILRQVGGTRKIPPDCLQAPSLGYLKLGCICSSSRDCRNNGSRPCFSRASRAVGRASALNGVLVGRSRPKILGKPRRPFLVCLKAGWLEIFGPVFHGFSAEVDPRDPP